MERRQQNSRNPDQEAPYTKSRGHPRPSNHYPDSTPPYQPIGSQRQQSVRYRLISVKSLPKSATEQLLSHYFRRFGVITSVSLTYPEGMNPANGYAILEFESSKTVDRICGLAPAASPPNHTIDGKEVLVKAIRSRAEVLRDFEDIRRRRVYVRRLPKELDEESLYEIFEPFGEIEKAYCSLKYKRRNKKGSGPSRKSGYVIFKNGESVMSMPRDGIVFGKYFIEWTSIYTHPSTRKPAPKDKGVRGGVRKPEREQFPGEGRREAGGALKTYKADKEVFKARSGYQRSYGSSKRRSKDWGRHNDYRETGWRERDSRAEESIPDTRGALLHNLGHSQQARRRSSVGQPESDQFFTENQYHSPPDQYSYPPERRSQRGPEDPGLSQIKSFIDSMNLSRNQEPIYQEESQGQVEHEQFYGQDERDLDYRYARRGSESLYQDPKTGKLASYKGNSSGSGHKTGKSQGAEIHQEWTQIRGSDSWGAPPRHKVNLKKKQKASHVQLRHLDYPVQRNFYEWRPSEKRMLNHDITPSKSRYFGLRGRKADHGAANLHFCETHAE